MMNWEEADVELRKTLVFLMQRMQKPVCLTLGKFFAVNTQLFLGVSSLIVIKVILSYLLADNENFLFILYTYIQK